MKSGTECDGCFADQCRGFSLLLSACGRCVSGLSEFGDGGSSWQVYSHGALQSNPASDQTCSVVAPGISVSAACDGFASGWRCAKILRHKPRNSCFCSSLQNLNMGNLIYGETFGPSNGLRLSAMRRLLTTRFRDSKADGICDKNITAVAGSRVTAASG